MNKSQSALFVIILLIFGALTFCIGHAVGYSSASIVFSKVYSEKIAQEEQDIVSDCLTKNGFVLNDVTYLCQPIMPIPSYAK